jgi:hypothetical protein
MKNVVRVGENSLRAAKTSNERGRQICGFDARVQHRFLMSGRITKPNQALSTHDRQIFHKLIHVYLQYRSTSLRVIALSLPDQAIFSGD